MARNSYRAGGKKEDEYTYAKEVSEDVESNGPMQSRPSVGYKGKHDPFGDESHSEVKYRTLAWWYVALSQGPILRG